MFLLFFKQKTAYEMRISDWSSDVCSSDLTVTVKTISPRCGARLSRDARLGAKSKRYFRPRNPIPASAAASGNSDLSLSRAARAEAIWSLPGIRRILLTHNLMLGALVTIRRIDSRAKVHSRFGRFLA